MSNIAICKDVKVDTEPTERSVTATISSIAIDRDNEVMLPKGVVLTNYRDNPVVQWAHDTHSPPIGKNEWIRKTKAGQLVAKTIFADTDRGNEVFQLFKGGFLNAFSVGFKPIDHREPDERDIKEHPEWSGVDRIISKWELLEYSVVPVPANPEALVSAISKGFKVSDSIQDKLGIMVAKQAPVEIKAVIPYKQYAKDGEETEWQAADEIKQATVDDLLLMSTWYDKDNPDIKNSYKLPHHRAGNKHVVWRAVSAAMGAFMGGRGGVNIPDSDRRGIYNHLVAHYDEFGKVPPEFSAEPLKAKIYTPKSIVVPKLVTRQVFAAKQTQQKQVTVKTVTELVNSELNHIRGIV